MQILGAFPQSTVTGADFVTGVYEILPGQRVVDLQVDVETLPAWGLLCLHESTVKLMMTELGWSYDENLTRKVGQQSAEIARLRKINKQMRDALVAVIEAATEAGVLVSPDIEPVPA